MGGRGLIRLKYIHAFRDRTGRMRYYFRRNGKRTSLPGEPGSTEFVGAYAALLADLPKQVEQPPRAAPRTFASLAIRYYGSPAIFVVIEYQPRELPSGHRWFPR